MILANWMSRTLAVGAITLLATPAAVAGPVLAVLPVQYANAEAPGAHTLLTTTSGRTQQIIYDNAVLAAAGIDPGTHLLGISFRLDSGDPASPASTFGDWTVRIGVAANSAATASTTFDSNVVGGGAGYTTVRTGALSLPAGMFPNGPGPNPFSAPIGFSTAFDYTGAGQGLVLTITHTGGTAAFFLDSFGRGSISGIASFNATSATATVNNDASGNTTVVAFEVPEPLTLSLLGLGVAALAGVRRQGRKDNPRPE